ncbi:hypothetical protein F9K50_01935 [bacterium]|nr:MAG: hypothetical protein F9K50_01935 [bacterium]
MSMLKSFGLVLCYFLFSGQAQAAASLPPDLKLSIDAPAEATFGEEFTYELTMENIGESSSDDVSLGFGLPTEGSLISIEASVGNCLPPFNGKVECEFGIVAPLAPFTVTVLWKAPEAEAVLRLGAQVSASGENIATDADNKAEVFTTVVAPPDVPVDDGGNADAGDNDGIGDGAAEAAGDQGGCSLNGKAPAASGPLSFLMIFMAMSWALRLRAKRLS